MNANHLHRRIDVLLDKSAPPMQGLRAVIYLPYKEGEQGNQPDITMHRMGSGLLLFYSPGTHDAIPAFLEAYRATQERQRP
jgi:hypothetical protein